MTPVESLVRYLTFQTSTIKACRTKRQASAGLYAGIPEVVLTHGIKFLGPGEPLTESEMNILDFATSTVRSFAQRECFYNSQRLAAYTDGRLRLFEGYALGNVCFPVLHSWVVTESNKVIDLTWRSSPTFPGHPNPGNWGDRFALGTMPSEAVYFGVELDATDSIRRMCDREECNSYLDDWTDGWPLLRRSAWI